MASSSSNAGRVYEDFEPPSDFVSEAACDTHLIYLPGFRKDQLKVQLTSSRVLKISGERLLGGNKWRRFHKEFPVQSNYDTRQISAKFEGGILYIRLPKLITPAAPEVQQQPQDKGKAALEPSKPQPPQPQALPLPLPPTQPQPEPQPKKVSPSKLAEEDAMARKDEIPQTPTAWAQPKPQKEAPPRDMPKLEEEEEEEKEKRKEVEEKKGGSELIRSPRQVFRGSGLFRELRKPESMKRLVISVVMVLAIGFYISYIFKSFTSDEQQKVVEYDQVEL